MKLLTAKGAFHYAKNFEYFGGERNGTLRFAGKFSSQSGPPDHLQRWSFVGPIVPPFHFKKLSFSAEKLSKFGSKRNRKLRSGCKIAFNRKMYMQFHFLLVSDQPGRSRARVRSERERRSREERRLVALRKKDNRPRFRPWLTGRFGKILKMEGTPGVWYVSCSSKFTSSC